MAKNRKENIQYLIIENKFIYITLQKILFNNYNLKSKLKILIKAFKVKFGKFYENNFFFLNTSFICKVLY